MRKHLSLLLIPLLLCLGGFSFSGCATNPVTGERELTLISETGEIQIGEEQYGPTQQVQGGPYATMPDLTVYVNEIGQKLAAVSDRPNLPYEFVVLNNPVPNAWALPGGKIAVNRGLLEVLENEAELAAVLAHEIVHAAARHSAQRVERQTIGNLATQAAVVGLAVALDDNTNRDTIVGAAHTAATLGSQLIYSKYSRDAETESDYYGMKYMSDAGYDPRAAVTLQEKFVKLSEGNAQNWLDGLFASHPPSRERVEANRARLAELPEGGTLGEAPYRARIRPLVQAKPAYDKYRRGTRALEEGDPAQALQLARTAQQDLPREGLFHALESQALLKQGRITDALNAIEKAVQRNPDYFAFHLVKGKVAQKLGNAGQAASAFERSNNLLPTAEAQSALGLMALRAGDERRAYRYLQQAAAFSNTEAGREAMQALVPLEVKYNPRQFLEAGLILGPEGQMLVRVRNRGSVPLRNIRLQVTTMDRQNQQLQIPYILRPGQSDTLKTRFGPYPGEPGSRAQGVVKVTAAEPAE